MPKKAAPRQTVKVEIPDVGLSAKQIGALKKSFKNQLVSSLGERTAARPRTVIIQIEIVFARAKH